MNIERNLLERINAFVLDKHLTISDVAYFFEMETEINETFLEVRELLAQPEQEPTTRHALDSYWNQEAYQRGYAEAKLKLKRKPITGIEISKGFKADDEATHPYSYWAGVDFAEKHHGIGGGE